MTKALCERLIKLVELIIAPAAIGAAALWDFDIAVYVGAVSSAIIAILRCVEVFLKK